MLSSLQLSIKVVFACIVQLHSISQTRLADCGLRGVHFWNKCPVGPVQGEMIKNGCLHIGLSPWSHFKLFVDNHILEAALIGLVESTTRSDDF
jgi:hypothetical protein